MQSDIPSLHSGPDSEFEVLSPHLSEELAALSPPSAEQPPDGAARSMMPVVVGMAVLVIGLGVAAVALVIAIGVGAALLA